MRDFKYTNVHDGRFCVTRKLNTADSRAADARRGTFPLSGLTDGDGAAHLRHIRKEAQFSLQVLDQQCFQDVRRDA